VVVFSHGIERRGWQAARAAPSRTDSPTRGRFRWLFPLWRLTQTDFSLRHGTALLVLNAEDLAYARDHYRRRAEDLFLFRNGIYRPPAREPIPPDRPPTLLFLGTWLPRKGIGTLVAAASLLHARGVMPRFILAGTGLDTRQVLSQWPEDLREAVEVLPHFPFTDELALYPRADVFVLPSLYEGQPLALLQAMTAGCCCVASDIAGNRDLLTHGKTGLLHPAGDAARLAADLHACLANPRLREDLGRKAREAVSARTWETVSGEVADFVERIIARQSCHLAGVEREGAT
jgi:glycosyltransferase involved in cell wall biosynthesis